MKNALVLGAFFGATGVMLGAFGAHGLRPVLPPARFEAFHTAVQYQLLHALALLAVSSLMQRGGVFANRWGLAVAYLWGLGTLLFSGSIYLLVLAGQSSLWFLTPMGGVLLIIGWITALIKAIAMTSKKT